MLSLSILGSTGSIGRQTLEVIQKNPRQFKVVALSCQKNIDLLAQQIKKFHPQFIAVENIGQAEKLKKKLNHTIKIFFGPKGILKLTKLPQVQLVINAIAGPAGLASTLSALKAKKDLALANKESLVIAGKKIMDLARKNKVQLIPIDSEHTAFFDIIKKNPGKKIAKIILPCSGGPFFGKTKKELRKVTIEQALAHPSWKNMGAKITIDSATLVNKGFEIIEAAHLFDLKPAQIEVIIHPESIIHAIVIFTDGTIAFRAGKNDMKIPINYVLNYMRTGGQANIANKRTNEQILNIKRQLSFFPPDPKTFLGLKFGYLAAKKGGDYPARFCLANEKAVQEFLKGKIEFLDIYKEIAAVF